MKLLLDSVNGMAKISPIDKFVKEDTQSFRATALAAGAKYNSDDHGYYLPLDFLPISIKTLEKLKMIPVITEGLSDALKNRAAQIQKENDELANRFSHADEILGKKGYQVLPYQKLGSRWLQAHNNALECDCMGLGKSIMASCAIPQDAPVVIVCGAAVKGVWKREMAMWRPEYSLSVLKGQGSFRWPVSREMVIVNPELLPSTLRQKMETIQQIATLKQDAGLSNPEMAAQIIKNITKAERKLKTIEKMLFEQPSPEGIVLICDEVHSMKSLTSQRSIRFRSLSEKVTFALGRVWGLTGTPMLNRPPELWAVLVALGLATLTYESYDAFVKVMGGRKKPWGQQGMTWHPTPKAHELLKQVMLRRERLEVLPQLPTKRYETIEVDCLDEETKKLCDEIIKALDEAGLDIQQAMERANDQEGSLLISQISAARRAIAICKIPAMLEIVEQYEEEEEPLSVLFFHSFQALPSAL